MSLPQIRADWAQHMVYGAWVGAAGAAVVMVLERVLGWHGLGLSAPAACLLAAALAGAAKELADWVSNRRARAYAARWGMSLTGSSVSAHEVAAGDVVATVVGALPVAVPMFLALWR
jgi:hypothetical protein